MALQVRKYCLDFLRGIIIVMLWVNARIAAAGDSKFSISYSNISAFIAVRAWEKFIPRHVQMHAYTQASRFAVYLLAICYMAYIFNRCFYEIHELLGMNVIGVLF